jgi:hypothetical protein
MARLAHLSRRFFRSLRPRRLGPSEQAEVAALLRDADAPLFWRQAPADQRHALDCARFVAAAAPGRNDLARAALFHDVGKSGVGLGLLGRCVASGLRMLHLPTGGRLRAYLDHGPSGAEELERVGAERVVVSFARHHHRARPHDIDDADWDLLCRADDL